MNNQAAFATYTPHAKASRAFNNYGWDIFDNPTFAVSRLICSTAGLMVKNGPRWKR